MGRAPLDMGKPGRITIRKLPARATPTGKLIPVFQARCRFRDFDGQTRPVTAQGRTGTAAQNALLVKLDTRRGVGSAELKPASTFAVAAALWLTQVEGTRAVTTCDCYRQWLNGRALPDLGHLRLAELRVPFLNTYFTRLRTCGYSASTRRMIRKVIRGPLNLAVQHEAIPANPLAAIDPIEGKSKQARALTPEERRRLLTWLDGTSDDPVERAAQETARRRELPDIVRVMLGTGLRIGELLGLRFSDLHLEGAPLLVDGEVVVVPYLVVAGNVVREVGEGLRFHEGKTPAAKRSVPLPPFVVSILRLRQGLARELGYEDAPVFMAVTADGPGWRDPKKVGGWLRDARAWVGLEWMTTHTWRKTAATLLDEAGLPPRAIADQMGHTKISMTTDTYLGRGGFDPAAATALQRALGGAEPCDDG